MKILLLMIGKTDASWLSEGLMHYEKRIRHYMPFELQVIPDLKNRKQLSEAEQKQAEAMLLMQALQATDELVLLDENGKQLTSRAFAGFIEKMQLQSVKRLVFVIGGPYGFGEAVRKRANHMLSLSEMTFPHQLVRLIFIEQLYRACTILRNEPYHHD
ncbi:MAG: 23S rRNA (pseudouridine(1915)-N(3))-methyltransferase RlmH [Bacteroidia bacterium]|jgi:23S rRNA (pseudouridine1915-N3)-methyltransferase|nr:23S rRNA (pseudouridine(1915)-N(3))-methyltransferase RlmH [Bacteroidia bacterium]